MKDLGLTLEEIHEDFEEEPVLRREKKDERGLKEEHRTFRLEKRRESLVIKFFEEIR